MYTAISSRIHKTSTYLIYGTNILNVNNIFVFVPYNWVLLEENELQIQIHCEFRSGK